MLTAINPTTGQVVREVEPLGIEEMRRRIGIAQDAFGEWSGRSFKERADLLLKVAKHIRDNAETLAPIMTEEMGKPIKEGRGEANKGAWALEHYAEHAEKYLERQVLESDATLSYVQHLPMGPVLGILPWNAPFWLAFRWSAPALMAGNTCLMKHDPHVPGVAQSIEDCFKAVGAPEGLLQSLPMETPDVEHAIRDKRIQAVSFTGSTAGGAKVASIAASEIKRHVLELGGSDPAIVLADADLELAAELIKTMRIINAGQSCIAAKRLIVEASVHDEFVTLLQKKLAALKVGDPAEEETDVGPIARKDLRDNLHRQVRDTIKAGATCLMGGEMPKGPGFFYPVTLLTGVKRDMAACREETFGPVAAVVKVASAAEALDVANDTEFGLGGSIFTDAKRGEDIARNIVTGQVAINGPVKTDPRLPSGGVKRSGYGRELGPQGILEFVHAQQVWIGPKQGD